MIYFHFFSNNKFLSICLLQDFPNSVHVLPKHIQTFQTSSVRFYVHNSKIFVDILYRSIQMHIIIISKMFFLSLNFKWEWIIQVYWSKNSYAWNKIKKCWLKIKENYRSWYFTHQEFEIAVLYMVIIIFRLKMLFIKRKN